MEKITNLTREKIYSANNSNTFNKKRSIKRNYISTNYTRRLICYYTNVDSLLSKKDELLAICNIHKIDVLLIAEVKLKTVLHQCSKLNLPSQDTSAIQYRWKTCKRGVCIYKRTSLDTLLSSSPNIDAVEKNQYGVKSDCITMTSCQWDVCINHQTVTMQIMLNQID